MVKLPGGQIGLLYESGVKGPYERITFTTFGPGFLDTPDAALPTTAAQVRARSLERLTLSVDPKVLNPVREKKATGRLTLTGFYSDGTQQSFQPPEAVITVRTKEASGNVTAVRVDGPKVVPQEGGIAAVEATVSAGGRRFNATTVVVVAPFYRDYRQTLVLKLFLGMEGTPVERLETEPLFQRQHDVLCTFEEALEVIRKTDNLTRGIPKIETQRKIFHYWRERGFDVTGEGIFWAHPPGEGFTGLQAMSWWYPGDSGYQMRIPECLMARGRTDRGGDGDFRFSSSMHGEEIWQKDKDTIPRFLGMFCRTTLPWYYLSRLERVRFENNVLYYSDGVVARTEEGTNIIRKGEFVLRENDNLFVPALWQKKEIIAYSRSGYENKTWRMPAGWKDVRKVDVYRITPLGCVLLKKGIPVTGANLVLSLGKDESVSIVPSGAKLSGRALTGGSCRGSTAEAEV